MARSRSRTLLRTIAVLIAATVFLSRRCSSNGSDGADDEREAAASEDAARYRPEGDEGLGVSIAILLDNSGSMEDRAKGDSRPKYVVAREAIEAMLAATDSVVARQP